MSLALEDVLGSAYLTGLVEDVAPGVPTALPPEFYKPTGSVLKDSGLYTRYAGVRKTSRRVEYGAPSRRRELDPIGTFPIKLLHSFEHIVLKIGDFMALRGYTEYGPKQLGREEVIRQGKQFKQLFDNLRTSLCHSAVAKGAIYWDANGNLLPSSSGAIHTTDFGVSANNRNQLNSIITASWALPATDIPSQLLALRERADAQTTGYPLRYAFYGRNVANYMMANTLVQAYLSRNPVTHQKWLDSGYIPDGLFDLTWVPTHKAFYVDNDGVAQAWWATDAVTFWPEVDQNTWGLLEGTYPVPTSFQPFASIEAAADSFDMKQGRFGFAIPCMNPPSAEILHFGDTVTPVIPTPDAVYFADVVP